MSRHGAKTARQKGCMRAHAPRRSRGEPATQREIARASLLNIASVLMMGRFSTAGQEHHTSWTCKPTVLPGKLPLT